MKEKRVFTVNDVEYAVRLPSLEEIREADEIQNQVFNKELQKPHCILREELDTILRAKKKWNDEMQMEYETLAKEIVDAELVLERGGIKLSDAKRIALEMRDKRQRMIDMLSSRTNLDSNTCEGRAANARFNFLYATCLVYNSDGKPYFPNGVRDYLIRQNDPVAIRGATEFYYLMTNTEDSDSDLPENKFLKKFKFVDDKLRPVDKEGRLIDKDGRHIDENGNYIKWVEADKYVYVDVDGRELEQNGSFKVNEPQPFLDDEGNPITV